MKQVHNVRVRIIDRSRSIIEEAFATVLQEAGIKAEDAKVTFSDDGEAADPLFFGELWIDHQQPVRKFIALLKTKLAEQQHLIAREPNKFIDTQTHCFLRLSKSAFFTGSYELTQSSDSVHVRLNIAAFPATKENAAKILSTLFSKD